MNLGSRFLQTSRTATLSSPSPAITHGVAAKSRADKKIKKYSPICRGIASEFTPAVIETFGTLDDNLIGLLRKHSKLEDESNYMNDDILFEQNDPLRTDPNKSFNAGSSMSYYAGQLTFTAVISHACMLTQAVDVDLHNKAFGLPMTQRSRRTKYSPRHRMPGRMMAHH